MTIKIINKIRFSKLRKKPPSREETFDKIVYLMNIESTKFRKPVFPETKIFTDVNALRSKGRVWRFEGNSYDGNQNAICEAKWSAMIMDRNSE